MKKGVTLIVALLFVLISATTVFAAKDDIAVAGNCTSATYYKEYITVSQLNSSIKSSEETFYRAKINVSSTGSTAACNITDLNYTLGDQKIVDTASKIRLLDSTLAEIVTANATYADGTYTKANFNGTIATVTNETNTTFYIEYRAQTLDSNKSVSTSISDIHYTENVSYWGLSDLTLENVTLVYKPTQWTNLQSITEVQYDGTAVTNYTTDASLGILYDPTFAADSKHFLLVKYTIPESGKGATGAGRTPPLGVTIPTLPAETFLVISAALIIIIVLLIAIAYYWGK
jgi:hypothetical protein